MDADWYADPLGRFDGRYWDGSEWTERVSDRGIQALDPDWPLEAERSQSRVDDEPQFGPATEPAIVPLVPAETLTPRSRSAAVTGSHARSERGEPRSIENDLPVGDDADRREPDGERRNDPVERAADLATRDVHHEPDADAADAASEAPASAMTESTRAVETAVGVSQSAEDTRIDYSVESPHRSVAVLDHPTVEQVDEAATPAIDDDRGARSWLLWLGAAALVALALLVLPRLFRGTDPNDVAVDDASADQISAADQEAATDVVDPGVEEMPAEEPMDAADDPPPIPTLSADVTPAEVPESSANGETTPSGGDGQVAAGDRIIANGETMLAELAAWHIDWARDNGGELADGGSCWFGVVGRALAQSAHCGPITTESGSQFTLVPVLFQDLAGEGVVEAVPVLDAVVPNAPLPTTIQFADASGLVDPASVGAVPGERGLRGG